ncbi:MAG: ABC transporter substrate-binding protein [Acidimicrobiia bacterium]
MKRAALLSVLLLVVGACSPSDTSAPTTVETRLTTTSSSSTTIAPTTTVEATVGFPVTVEADNGTVAIEDRPEAVVSLSSTATEMLFAVGAGPQVVAVDDQSSYPAEAPITDLSGFTPNLEAILSYAPDLVVIAFDPGDLVAGLDAAGVPVLSFGAALTIDDVYRQLEVLGIATGNHEGASETSVGIQEDLASIVADAEGLGEGVSFYHEIDALLYTVTSSTFFGAIYGLFGMENIADPADEDNAAFGYPQLSGEYVVASDPDIIFLANTLYGESAETVSERPGWEVMTAVGNGDIVELDSDIASRWGPRIVDFAQAVADALRGYRQG